MPSLSTWAPFCAMVLPMWTMLSACWKQQSHGWFCQGCKATNHTGTLRNFLNPAFGTYTNTRRNSSEPSGTFRTLLLEPTQTRARRNSPEPSGICQDRPEPTFRNLPEPTSGTYASIPSGTFQSPPPELRPEHAGTVRNLPEPFSGTCSCDPHRHTPELIWAEDPISSRCWEKSVECPNKTSVIWRPSYLWHFYAPPRCRRHTWTESNRNWSVAKPGR